MKRSIWMSDKTKLFLFALLSFLVFLLLYALILGLESILGGGQAFLWFLILVPALFIAYHLVVGALCFRVTDRALATVVSQFLATLAADLVVLGVNLISARFPFFEERELLWFDLAILCCQPLLCYCGIRIVKLWRTVKVLRAFSSPRKTESDGSDPQPEKENEQA